MLQVLRRVAKENGLSNEEREKPPMYTEDVVEILQTNLTTTEKRYSHGRHRIQLALWFHGAFITANRPQALLSLRYRHIAITLLRDPKGGPHRILLEFTFEFTKTYLGMKDAYVSAPPRHTPHMLFLHPPVRIYFYEALGTRSRSLRSSLTPPSFSALMSSCWA